MNKRSNYLQNEIDPDEIFLDSSNLPQFDTHQFEGRIEKSITRRTVFVTGAIFILIALIFIYRLTSLQVAEGSKYKGVSENNRLHHSLIFSERGVITDRNGGLLAWNTMDASQTDYSLRAYATEPGLSTLLGYVKYPKKDKSGFYYNTEYSGADGVEKYYNKSMTGENGLKITETNALGAPLSESMVRPAKRGENLTLTIDKNLQAEMYKSIQNVSEQSNFHGGAGVLMDIKTGEVLSSVSYPEYDSNVMTDGSDVKAINNFLTNENNPFLDRVTSGQYTPGSIVKPLFAVAALQEGVIAPSKQIESTGSMKVPNPYKPGEFSIFKDWRVNGWTDMRHAIAVSSDIYFYQVGGGLGDQKGLGITNIDKYASMFGLGSSIENSYFSGKKGVIPTPAWKKVNFNGEDWRLGDTYNTSIGQYGFQVTPIQAVRAIAAVANSGKLLTPTILKGEIGPTGSTVINPTFSTLPISSADYYQIAREGMRLAVTDGTLTVLNVPYVSIAAKSGTAELGTQKKYINSWVVGFFPYDHPRYAFAALLERGPATATVGATAAMKNLFEWMSIYAPDYLK